ncbi:hypothetical protein [Bacillus bingmayongensis]|uniref:hypothetical protein n=1 Tax=Bacillus bingmayongensis TaxID=1150157 RepID=UPI0002F18656|nr:hypothetical protein [Bacillus bingmayongensis]
MIRELRRFLLPTVTAAALLLPSLFGATNHVEAATTFGPSMKSVLMYAGKIDPAASTTYNTYKDTELTNLMKGANQFIVLSPKISVHDDTDYKLKLDLIKKIIAKDSSAKIWLGTLHRGSNSTDFKSDPLTAELEKFKTELGSVIWTNNIVGIYVNVEHVYKDTADPNGTKATVYTGDYWSKLNNSMNSNVTVQLFKALDTWASSSTNGYKKLAWAPYVDTDTDILRRVAWVTNQTNLFDVVLLQPNWYFHGDTQQNGTVLNKPDYLLKVVKKSMINGTLSYTDGSYILPQAYVNKRIGTIGVDMEYDEKIAGTTTTNITKYNRLIDYETTFKEELASKSYPFTYYMGSPGANGIRYLDMTTTYGKYTWEYMVDYYSNGTVHPKK